MPRIYYLDEQLGDHELHEVLSAVRSFVAKPVPVESAEQVRVPGVLPLPDKDGLFKEGGAETHTTIVRRNLINAGIHNDRGKQVVWVMPKQAYWGNIFQMAIFEETGFFPYMVQRWYMDESGEMKRGDLRVINAHGLMQK